MLGTRFTTVDQLIDFLARLGSSPSSDAASQGAKGNDFTDLDHALQCAFELQRRAPVDVELHVAGLFHDIGHQFAPNEAHATEGGEAVRPILGDRVAAVVAEHVRAKRYLISADPGYCSHLSAESVTTLAAQGGPLTVGEVAAFRASSHWQAAVTLRRADDDAKIPGRRVPGLGYWLPAIRRVAGA